MLSVLSLLIAQSVDIHTSDRPDIRERFSRGCVRRPFVFKKKCPVLASGQLTFCPEHNTSQPADMPSFLLHWKIVDDFSLLVLVWSFVFEHLKMALILSCFCFQQIPSKSRTVNIQAVGQGSALVQVDNKLLTTIAMNIYIYIYIYMIIFKNTS